MRAIGTLIAVLLLTGCQATGPVRPFEDANGVEQISEEENRLWHQAEEFDLMLGRANELYPDATVNAYLQRIMDRLYPEFDGRIRVQAVKSPALNAFALPNGSIYVHIGLIARMDNEAQLATVLAHEGAHFTQKHGLLQQRNLKSSTVFATSLAVVGIPVMPELLAASSIYGYSRDLERDADRVGFERLVRAGYAPQEAAKTFEHLAAEVKALDVDEPFFFSSHPKLSERIESYNALAGSASGGALNQEDYTKRTNKVRVDSLEADLSMGRYESVILALSELDNPDAYPAHIEYYLGEAYRRRGDEEDMQRAAAAFEGAVKAAPKFAPSYRSLGVLAMKEQRWADAMSNFNTYLGLAPQADDRAYVEQYVTMVNEKMGSH